MNIRSRLTIQYLTFGGAIMIFASLAIYIASSEFRRDSFQKRLENRANRTARMLIEVEGIDVNLMRRIDSNNPIMLPREKIVVYTAQNDTLYNSNTRYRQNITPSILSQIRSQRKLMFRQDDLEVVGTTYNSGGADYVIIASAQDIDGINHLKSLRTILLIVCIGSFVLITVAGWIFAGKALAPISGVIKSVEEISASNLSKRLDQGNGTDEIARLAMTFNSMLDRLEEAFKMQKSFISNASHEIRNPLTSISGQLQVLVMKSRNISEYEKTVESVLDDIRNLTNLVNSLLLLAQAQSDASSIKYNNVRLDEIVLVSAEEIRKEHPYFKVNLNYNIKDYLHDQGLVISGNDYLLKTVVLNLIENGCKYSDQHSVDVSILSSAEAVTLTIQDKGPGIPGDELHKIFEPFFRGKNSMLKPGHGVGLSLVKRIIESHNGKIHIESDPASGTTVTVKLPRDKRTA